MWLNSHLPPYAKVNSKWMTNLNSRDKTIKLPEENTGEKLHGIGFLGYDTKSIGNKRKKRQMGLH